jgi:acetylornithine deacetylase
MTTEEPREAGQRLDRAIDDLLEDAAGLLERLIQIPSPAGSEGEAQHTLLRWLQTRGMECCLQEADAELESDPDYVPCQADGRHAPNVRMRIGRAAAGKTLVLNSHMDVVPPEAPSGFAARRDNGIIHGRGACDAKGQVVTICLAMLAVREAGLEPSGECVGLSVVEEEAGGNGTLAWIRAGERADGCVVLEPSRLEVHPANRGALWFRILVRGKATHMGRWWEGRSAFEDLGKVLAEVRAFGEELVERSRDIPLFPSDPSPVHVNIGEVRAGDWPSTVPAMAEARGAVSFLPNASLEEVRSGLESAVQKARQRHGVDAEIRFDGLANAPYALDVSHPLPALLAHQVEEVRGRAQISGYLASCDARLMHHRAGIPTVVFGPGDLRDAHSASEKVTLEEIRDAARALARLIVRWCDPETG